MFHYMRTLTPVREDGVQVESATYVLFLPHRFVMTEGVQEFLFYQEKEPEPVDVDLNSDSDTTFVRFLLVFPSV